MTFKSRKRKRAQKLKWYRFLVIDEPGHQKEIEVEATSLNEARTLFHDKYGYWPEKEITDDHE